MQKQKIQGWLLAAMCMICAWGGLAPAYAQSSNAPTVHIQMPAQPLGQALTQLAAQTGLLIGVDAALVSGKTAPAIDGNYTPEQALHLLLQGSGLQATRQANGGYTLSAAGEAVLSEVQVEAASDTYAGGQVATNAGLGMLGNRDMMNTPFSVTSYTTQTIENQQARTVADVLENDASFQINSARTNINEDFSVRGFAMAGQDIAINGMYGLTPFYRTPVEMAERIELLKGPSAMLSGMAPDGNVGGVINIVTKHAGAEPLARITESYLSDSLLGSHVDLGHRFGDHQQFGIRFNGAYSGGDTTVDNQSRNERFGSLNMDYAGERLRVSIDLIAQRENIDNEVRQFTTSGLTHIPSAPDNSLNYPGYGVSNMTDTVGILHGEYDITERVTVYAGYGDRSSKMDAVAGNPVLTSNSGDFSSSPAWQLFNIFAHSAEAGVRANFDTGFIKHQLTLGATRLIQDQDIQFVFAGFGTAQTSNLYNPTYYNTPTTEGLARDPVPYISTTLTGYALADTLSVWDERLQLTLGARRQHVESQNHPTNFQAGGPLYDESATTPSVGVLYKITNQASLYANYIEGLSQGPTAPIGTTNAGEVFAPYKSKQKEAGIKIDWGKLGTTLGVFEIKRPSSVTNNNVFAMNGEQRNRGLELNAFGEVTSGIRLMGSATYIQAKLTSTQGGTYDGNHAIGVPEKQLKLNGEFDIHGVQGLTLIARAVYTDKQYIDQANDLVIPSWVRFDAGARYITNAFKNPVTLRLNIENLFDKNYWNAGPNGYLYLGASRTVLLSASVDL